jgi:hypothetical protein
VQNTVVLEPDGESQLFGPDSIREAERQVEVVRVISKRHSHDIRVMLILEEEK